MNDNASARPLKARITHARQVRWMEAAVAFMEDGESPAGVPPLLCGGWKVLSGSIVAAPAAR